MITHQVIYYSEAEKVKVIYANDKLRTQCTNLKMAKRLFGGNEILGRSLLSRINALENAMKMTDITSFPPFHFHKLHNKDGRNLEGYFAIDVKTRREPWRIILELLDENENVFDTNNIDQIATMVKVVKIEEVSNHYE